MENAKIWKKYFRFQEKPGWCGVAVIQMILARVGIKKDQKEIAKDVYIKWWGTPPQIILAYLSRFFKIVNYKQNSTIKDVSFHLNKGNFVVLNWWDDLDTKTAGGHFSIAAAYDHRLKALTLADPSTDRPGIWTIADTAFRKIWYDTTDVHDITWIEGWMLWVDPKSKI